LTRKARVKGPVDLSAAESTAWSGFVAAHAYLSRKLDERLRHDHGLSLATYDVLVNLARAPEQRLRMSDLAAAVHFSLGGVSKLVGRLEADGLVTREPAETDGRGKVVGLTDAGRSTVRAARASHLASVQQHFLSHAAPEDLALLGEFWRRVLTADG
jgi:DNA-binding MarR family transcriptional regulator